MIEDGVSISSSSELEEEMKYEKIELNRSKTDMK